MHDELLQLMMKFKLCYEIPDQKGTYIAPQLLSSSQPHYDWIDIDNLIVRYTYELMPAGILTQVITTMHPYILDGKIVWKNGVVLKIDETYVEIIEYYGKREIKLRISGPNKKGLLSVVNLLFDRIHATYRSLKHDRWIPCNCEVCKATPKPHYYRYETLQRFLYDNQEKIQCLQSYEMVDVHKLIDDVIKGNLAYPRETEVPRQFIVQGDYIEEDKKMTEINQNINKSTIHGSVVAAESIQDSFNTIEKADIKDDLKEQLKQLNQAVEAMTRELPKEQAEETADFMKVVAEQGTKEKPNSALFSVSIDGLIKAAQNIGKVGDAVIEVAGKVRKILTGGIL